MRTIERVHELLLAVAQQVVDAVGEDVCAFVLDHSLIHLELLPPIGVLETRDLLAEVLQRHGADADVIAVYAQIGRGNRNDVELGFFLRRLVD